MRNVDVRSAAIAVCGTVLVAGQTTRTRPAVAPPPRPAVAHATSCRQRAADRRAEQTGRAVLRHVPQRKRHAGELSLASFDAAKVTEHADVGEKMIRKLRAGMMPPPGARRPDAATLSAFVDALETKLDTAAALSPNPGWRPFQRLNRAEYARAVRDLLGIDVDVNAYLPPDTISGGFDNVVRRAELFADPDGRLSARGQPDQPARRRRSQRDRVVGDLQDRPHRLADAAGRGRPDGHPRRHLRSSTSSRPTATTSSRCRCTTSRSAASTAATRC